MMRIKLEINGKEIRRFDVINTDVLCGFKTKYRVLYRGKDDWEVFYVFHLRKDGAEVLSKKVIDKFLDLSLPK